MKLLLATSPHLDHSVFHRRGRADPGSARIAQCFAPMGLISLAGAAERLAEIEIADINKAINSGRLAMSGSFYVEAAKWLLEENPDVIGFMTETDSYHHLLNVFREVRQIRPSVITLLGGVHATAVHRETLEQFPQVDFIIRGEGEVALPSLLETVAAGRSLDSTGNLSYRHHARVISTPDLPLVPELDSLPFPDFSRLDLALEDVIYVEIGRGCPFKCNFCFTAPYWQRKHRIKSATRVMSELRYFRDKFGRSDFNFTHDLLTTDRRWVIDFCRQLSESDLRVTWTCSSRTDTIDEEQIEWLARAGCRNIYFGVETGTTAMQAAIEKNLDLRAARQIIARASQSGIAPTVGFIAGLPRESDESLRGTLEEGFHYLTLPGSTVHVFGYSPYRGSPVFEKIRAGLVFDPHFLDLPLPEEMHELNCTLMQQHFDIFTRYSRSADLPLDMLKIVRALEELFPIVNALSHLCVVLYSRGLDPLGMAGQWADWIHERNLGRGIRARGLYQGTIADFLDFIESLLGTASWRDEVTVELVRWERAKNALRLAPPTIPSAEAAVRTEGGKMLRRNPTVVVEAFENAAAFIPEAQWRDDEERSDQFAFYKQGGGQLSIVKLPPLASLILTLTRSEVDRGTLLKELGAELATTDQQDRLEMLVRDLEAKELLIPA